MPLLITLLHDPVALGIPLRFVRDLPSQVAELQERNPGRRTRANRQEPRRDVTPGGRQVPRGAEDHQPDHKADRYGGKDQAPDAPVAEQRLLAFLVHGRNTTADRRITATALGRVTAGQVGHAVGHLAGQVRAAVR